MRQPFDRRLAQNDDRMCNCIQKSQNFDDKFEIIYEV